jgi:O-antigen ligase
MINKFNFFNSSQITLFLALIIPLLISGPFLPDLIVSLSSLFFLFYILRTKKFRYFNNKPLIFFFIFCIYCIISSLFSDNILLSFESSLFFFRIGIFACVIWYFAEKNDNLISYFYNAILICFSVLTFDGYVQYFFGKNLIGLPIYGVRVSSFFGEELILGSYLSRLFPLLFALFVAKKEKNRFEIYYIGILFILIDVMIYITGERTAFVFLNISTVFIIVLIKKYQYFRLATFIISILITLFLTFSSSNIKNRMITGPIQDMGLDLKSSQKYIFTPAHDSLIKTGLNMFLDEPFFGHGPKMFREKCSNLKYSKGIKPCSTHPHNFYIQLLAETGIVGFSFLVSIFCYVVYNAYRQLKSIIFKKQRYLTDYQVCLLAGIFISVWPFSPNGNFFNNWLAIIYSLPIGFYLHTLYLKDKDLLKKNK